MRGRCARASRHRAWIKFARRRFFSVTTKRKKRKGEKKGEKKGKRKGKGKGKGGKGKGRLGKSAQEVALVGSGRVHAGGSIYLEISMRFSTRNDAQAQVHHTLTREMNAEYESGL